MFIQPVSIKFNNKEEYKIISSKLEQFGYTPQIVTMYEEYIVTNYIGHNDHYSDSYSNSINKHGRYFVEDTNIDLFLALAAMTDKEYGIVGEYWKHRTHSSKEIFKCINLNAKQIQLRFLRSDTFFSKDSFFSYYRKATKEEIIEYFMKNMTEDQFLSRYNLIQFYRKFDCIIIKKIVTDLLNSNLIYLDNELIRIPKKYIEQLFNEGTQEQKEFAIELGLSFRDIFNSDLLKAGQKMTVKDKSSTFFNDVLLKLNTGQLVNLTKSTLIEGKYYGEELK